MNTDKREVGIALCGAIVGVMLTASTLTAQTDFAAALSNSVWVAPSVNDVQVLPRADVLRRQPRANSFVSSAAPAASASSSSVATDPVPILERDCILVRELAGTFLVAIDKYVPKNVENTGIIAALKDAAEGKVDFYCANVLIPHPASASSTAASSSRTVDNDCEQYSRSTDRYYTCMAKEQMGIRYIDPISR